MAIVAVSRPATFQIAAIKLPAFAFGVFIVLVGALHQLRPALDPDLGWHLRSGQMILSTHAIPRTDSFSHTFAGAAWVDFEWLWETALAVVYASGGRLAAIVAVALLTAGIYWLAYATLRLRRVPPILAAFGVGFCSVNLASYADVRPGIMGALFAAEFVFVLELARARANWRWLLLLLPAEALWANMHGSFILGPAICGLYAVAAAWDQLAGGQPIRHVCRSLLPWGALCAGLVAASLANPLGTGLLRFTLSSATLTTNVDYNGEWAAPNFHQAWAMPLLVTTLAALALPLLSRRVRLSRVEMLLLVCATALVLRNSQFVTFYAVAAAPTLATMLNQLLNRPLNFGLSLPVGLLLGLILVLMGFASVQSLRPEQYDAQLAKRYPVGAVSYIQQNQLGGPMWNEFDWGCYLISALPRLLVSIDGRTEMYGDDFFKQYYDVATGATSPGPVLDRYGINLALLQQKSAVATLLRADLGWHETYRDDITAIFVREGA
ncbi:MAG TPA: hypothetical protein VF157_01310 [Chloroflexota bacterium]